MDRTGSSSERSRRQRAFNLTLATVAGAVGCLTLVVISLALVVGLWLDNRFQTRPIITIVLMVGSIPVTLVAMFWIVRSATSRMLPETGPDNESTEEQDSRQE